MIKYTSVDRILSIVTRELGDTSFTESDYIEWIGEALEFLSVYPILEEKVKFIKVTNNRAKLPDSLVHILQVAKIDKEEVLEEFLVKETLPKVEDKCNPEPCSCYNKQEDNFNYRYTSFIRFCERTKGFIPVRLSNHTFFKSLVCKENNYDSLYQSSTEEYSIIGTINKELLFSFEKGMVALSFLSLATDKETGYPLIPDLPDFISAITYYIKWKISEAMTWRGREGYSNLIQYARQEWLRYARQAKNYAKMPKTLDEHQNLMESSYSMIPDFKQYYKNFSNYTRMQIWNNP